jgi:hypothetical protein
MGVEGKEIQTKGIDNLFNRILADNSLNLKKDNHQSAGSLQNTKPLGPKKKHPKTYHNQNTQHTEQRKNSESCKREQASHIKKANPLE